MFADHCTHQFLYSESSAPSALAAALLSMRPKLKAVTAEAQGLLWSLSSCCRGRRGAVALLTLWTTRSELVWKEAWQTLISLGCAVTAPSLLATMGPEQPRGSQSSAEKFHFISHKENPFHHSKGTAARCLC